MTSLRLAVVLGMFLLAAPPLMAQEKSAEKPVWPKGEILKFEFKESKIYPGTVRDYNVYVPAQYDGTKDACVYICQDGIMYNAPNVFDELIHKGEMPVTIGVFIKPGENRASFERGLGRYNRSYEYDAVGPRYANFLLEELLPDVETKKTSKGLPIKLSDRGTDRCMSGNSSGGVCAFTVAWEKPEQFSRVFTGVGTYVGLRGADAYATLIRKYEPKPIRVFLEDGAQDLNIYAGDWWMANNMMLRALQFMGYEVDHAFSEDGAHNAKHATEVFPDAMRFLWKNWPEAPKAGKASPDYQELFYADKGWVEVTDSSTIKDLFTQPESISAHGMTLSTKAVTYSPDYSVAYQAEPTKNYINSSIVGKDGQLLYTEPYFYLHTPDDTDGSGAQGMAVDHQGYVYIATRLGVQVCDAPGRVRCILPLPTNAPVEKLAFGGENNQMLYVTSGGKIFSRPVKRQGHRAGDAPVKQVKPRL